MLDGVDDGVDDGVEEGVLDGVEDGVEDGVDEGVALGVWDGLLQWQSQLPGNQPNPATISRPPTLGSERSQPVTLHSTACSAQSSRHHGSEL